MQRANPIRRRFRGDWAWLVTGSPQARRVWVAICPECGGEIQYRQSYPYNGQATRKNTKDALYRHVQEQHKPGLVGR